MASEMWTSHYKMEAAQYLEPLLSNQGQNFTIWALFGHTLHYSKDRGRMTSMEAHGGQFSKQTFLATLT